MTNIEHVSTSPPVLHINGREHVLYDEYVGPLKFADVKRLWLVATNTWLLVAVLAAGAAMRTGWVRAAGHGVAIFLLVVAATLAALVFAVVAAVSVATKPVLVAPVTAVEVERSGPWSTLSITTRRHGALAVVARTEMADFLLSAFAPERGKTKTRVGAPAALADPRSKRYVWAAYGAALAMVAVAIATVAQLILTFAGEPNS